MATVSKEESEVKLDLKSQEDESDEEVEEEEEEEEEEIEENNEEEEEEVIDLDDGANDNPPEEHKEEVKLQENANVGGTIATEGNMNQQAMATQGTVKNKTTKRAFGFTPKNQTLLGKIFVQTTTNANTEEGFAKTEGNANKTAITMVY